MRAVLGDMMGLRCMLNIRLQVPWISGKDEIDTQTELMSAMLGTYPRTQLSTRWC